MYNSMKRFTWITEGWALHKKHGMTSALVLQWPIVGLYTVHGQFEQTQHFSTHTRT